MEDNVGEEMEGLVEMLAAGGGVVVGWMEREGIEDAVDG